MRSLLVAFAFACSLAACTFNPPGGGVHDAASSDADAAGTMHDAGPPPLDSGLVDMGLIDDAGSKIPDVGSVDSSTVVEMDSGAAIDAARPDGEPALDAEVVD